MPTGRDASMRAADRAPRGVAKRFCHRIIVHPWGPKHNKSMDADDGPKERQLRVAQVRANRSEQLRLNRIYMHTGGWRQMNRIRYAADKSHEGGHAHQAGGRGQRSGWQHANAHAYAR